ncbi:ead/Ea22-like family protein [Klebsiella variicola]|uniref:ead/Ea22-like family protein n=1 Tax=Klebsiella variicola TaxID=244366 RepID=UPI000B402F02|nr:ead/Ea22-like family protein [Klebsiella variicola]
MTTDITELAQSLKAAAEKATPGQWVAFIDTRSRTFAVHTPDDNRCGNIIKWTGFDGQRKAKADAEFIAMANPANILALVEALEKAQGMEAYWKTQCRGITDHCEELQASIAELESRTVTVKFPYTPEPSAFAPWVAKAFYQFHKDTVKSCVEAFSDACAAAGIKMEVE